MPEPIIRAHNLSKRYGQVTAVDAIDVEVERGEFWGLLGPNGAGKTTFLRMLIGGTPPSAGELSVLGYPIPAQAVTMRRRAGIVPQLDNLDPDFTVAENLRSYARFFDLSGARVDRRIDELLAFASLEKRRDTHINTLSGGMLRRLSLVRALVNDPELLVLDEPTTGLDPQARQLIWQRLRELRQKGLTLVLTTHYMEEAQRLCDRVTVMDHGRILDSDRPADLIRRHIEPHVIEVHGTGVEAWHETAAKRFSDRTERVGETVFCYARDESGLLGSLAEQPSLSFLHRPANLEDVFVKLTGRELREGQ